VVNDLLGARAAHCFNIARRGRRNDELVFFERAIALLVKFAALPRRTAGDSDAIDILESLFHLVLSGTHAPVEMRVKAVESLLNSGDADVRSLRVRALESLMKTSLFSSHYEFEFGARSRDYGYHPRTGENVRAWFDAVLKLASRFALSDGPVAEEAQKAIAHKFPGLWRNSGCAEDLDRLARDIATKSFWREGWIAARHTRAYDGKVLKPEFRERLTALEQFLRPNDVVSKVRGIAPTTRGGSIDLDDFDDEENDEEEANGTSTRHVDYAARVRAPPRQFVSSAIEWQKMKNAFNILLPELISGDGRVWAFGEALAEATAKPRTMWNAIVAQFAATEGAGLHLLLGYLSGLLRRDSALVNALLDEAIEDQVLAEWFPILQANVTINERALARLRRALDLGKAPLSTFNSIAHGRACSEISGPQFRDLVLAIGSKPGGCPVGLEMVSMRLHPDRNAEHEPLPEVLEAGRLVLGQFEFQGKDDRATLQDYQLGIVIRASLAGLEGVSVTRSLCRKFRNAAADHVIRSYNYDNLMKGLLQVHPVAVLDELFPGDVKSLKESVGLLHDILGFHKRALDVLPDEILLGWCDQDPLLRYPLAAAVGTLFKRPNEGEPHQWTPLPRELLERAPDPGLVLNGIIKRLYPSSWSGSLATKLEGRLKHLNSLPGSDRPALAAVMAEAKANLQASIDAERLREAEEGRARSNRFE
jgi:hypothetical protein